MSSDSDKLLKGMFVFLPGISSMAMLANQSLLLLHAGSSSSSKRQSSTQPITHCTLKQETVVTYDLLHPGHSLSGRVPPGHAHIGGREEGVYRARSLPPLCQGGG